MRTPVIAGVVLLTCVRGLLAADPPAAARKVDFNREVRTILSENCFVCHGPDTKALKGDLRLDQRAGAFRSHDGVTVIVPGKPDESELVTRIVSTDPTEKMPPADSGKKLTPKQVETIKQWIAQGAEWKEHWSYIPPQQPAVPTSDDPGFVKNDIDRFISKVLKDKGLTHS